MGEGSVVTWADPVTGPPGMSASWPLSTSLPLGALPGATPCARLHARAVLHDWGLDELAEAAELIVSELVTNAVRHGGHDIERAHDADELFAFRNEDSMDTMAAHGLCGRLRAGVGRKVESGARVIASLTSCSCSTFHSGPSVEAMRHATFAPASSHRSLK